MSDGGSTQSTETVPPDPGQLKAGDRLAGRFVIVRFLARGGMGEVYEAADEHLQGKRCALKTLRPEIAADPVARQRFEREVLLAREIAHPNVCPTYDLFREDTPQGPLLFLTMKLLRGVTLGARLKRAGKLDSTEALAVARQMAAALDAAHRAGVIHRDFKPGNVMLESADEELRVSITDFGISRLRESEGTLAQTGAVAGTPGYMAPELFSGQTASPASDVYAFGVVLHEVLTGRKLENKPGRTEFVRPSKLDASVPRGWDPVVLGCLAYDPAARFQSAGEALAALDAATASGRATTLPQRIGRRRMLPAGAVAALLGAVAAWLSWSRIDALLRPLPGRRFVALLAWPPSSDPEVAPLIRGVLDSIGSRLARAESSSKNFVVLASGDVPGQAPPKTLADLGGSLGANLALGVALRFDRGAGVVALRVHDVSTGAVLREREVSLPGSRFARLGEEAAGASAQLLDLPADNARRSDQEELAKLSPEAYRLYQEAESLREQPNDSGLDAAMEKYQKALEVAPRFALGYASLALAYGRKYFRTSDRALLSVARKNAALAARYNPDSARAAHAEGLVALHSGEHDQAIREFRRALEMEPGNPRMQSHQALVFRELGRYQEEEDLHRRIIRERPNYWPAHNELGWALYRRGKHDLAASAFGEAAAVAPRVALPLANQATMLLLAGREKEAETTFLASVKRAPNETALGNLGTILFKKGDYGKAREYYEQALAIRPSNHRNWRNLADCYAMLGDRAREAESYAKAASVLSAGLKINPRPAGNWMVLAFYYAKSGRRADADASLKQADALGGGDARAQFLKVQALAVLGRRDDALVLLLKCLDQGITPLDVELALDLKELRTDPRYRRRIARTETVPSH